jgi:DNA adenine methylase
LLSLGVLQISDLRQTLDSGNCFGELLKSCAGDKSTKKIPDGVAVQLDKSPSSQDNPKPFLRWVGGKRQLVSRLVGMVPRDYPARRYFEPFLGAGSLYFALKPARAILSDANEHLMQCYLHIRDSPTIVARHLQKHARQHCADYYYSVRAQYNLASPSPAQAARFVYLNQSCFNGVFRVNKEGNYNVPYGRKERLRTLGSRELTIISSQLKGANLRAADFAEALAEADSGDFVYLDPPYPPLNRTAYFAHYTADRFDAAKQESLAEQVRMLAARGCLFMMSNADVPHIRKLYLGFRITTLSTTRYVTCKKRKYRIKELVITNY